MVSHARGPGSDTGSGVKLTLYGGIATTLITVVGGIIVAAMNKDDPSIAHTPMETTPTIITMANEARPDAEVSVGPMIDGKLTVSGSAQKDVNGMWVVLGPKPAGGYDADCAKVANQRWQAAVATDSSWQKYPVMTVPSYGSCGGATSARAFKVTFQGTQPTTPPPAPSDVILTCVEQSGPTCFQGPEFGPPTVYEPTQ